MMDCTLVFVADIVVGLGARLKKRRMREEMVAVLKSSLMLAKETCKEVEDRAMGAVCWLKTYRLWWWL